MVLRYGDKTGINGAELTSNHDDSKFWVWYRLFPYFTFYNVIYLDDHFELNQSLLTLTRLSEREVGDLSSTHASIVIGYWRDEVESYRGGRALVGGGLLRMF